MSPASDHTPCFHPRCHTPPRKVRVASVLRAFSGDLSQRTAQVLDALDQVRQEARARFPGKRLDAVLLPEGALQRVDRGSAQERAVPLDERLLETFGQQARALGAYLLLPLILEEGPRGPSNAVVLLDRTGRVVGLYRKVFPVNDPQGNLEGGIRPGAALPVFETDFGRIGILICWDMAFPEAWAASAQAGAEMVFVASASPQTVRPAAFAMLHGYYVLTSTPRDNVSLLSPIGTVLAQRQESGVLLAEVDLAYAVLHWSEALHEGECFREAFGDRVGFVYSSREDTGVFWSNDPSLTIAQACASLGLVEMRYQVDAGRRLQDQARGGPPPAPTANL